MKFSKTTLAALASAALVLPLGAVTAQVTSETGTPGTASAPADQPVTDSAQDPTTSTQTDTQADTQAATNATAGATAAATPADVKPGVAVHDPEGGVVGTVESVDANGAVVATGKVRAQIPVSAFAKNDAGLVISLTKAQLEAEAAKTPS